MGFKSGFGSLMKGLVIDSNLFLGNEPSSNWSRRRIVYIFNFLDLGRNVLGTGK